MEKQGVQVGNLRLGAGQPAVCIPVMGKDLQAIEAAALAAKEAQADIIELRADSFSPMPTAEEAKALCSAVRKAAPDVPLLFTLRTMRDGGGGSADTAAYEALLAAVMQARMADAVDVELSADRAFLSLCDLGKSMGIPVIGSCHHFEGTPSEDKIFNTLVNMARLGASVSKIAVMPKYRLDVLTLMRAAVRADEETSAPIVAIAMGKLGTITRACGAFMGSCLTFGTAGAASAPGQMDAKTLRGVLEVIHKA